MKIKNIALNEMVSIIFMFMAIFTLCAGGYMINRDTPLGIMWIGSGVFLIGTFWNHERLDNA